VKQGVPPAEVSEVRVGTSDNFRWEAEARTIVQAPAYFIHIIRITVDDSIITLNKESELLTTRLAASVHHKEIAQRLKASSIISPALLRGDPGGNQVVYFSAEVLVVYNLFLNLVVGEEEFNHLNVEPRGVEVMNMLVHTGYVDLHCGGEMSDARLHLLCAHSGC
jgi:hypothetical protein